MLRISLHVEVWRLLRQTLTAAPSACGHAEMPDAQAAASLRHRAAALLQNGTEAVLSDRRDRPCTSFYWHRPCCKWKSFRVTVHVKGKTGVMDQLQCAYRCDAPPLSQRTLQQSYPLHH